jgi:DNA polymerase-3 subunit epsilon
VLVTDDELAAHEARLEKLRKKAGRAVWDVMLEEEAATAVA